MKIAPRSISDVPQGRDTYRRELIFRSIPFFAILALAECSLLLPPGVASYSDAGWSVVLFLASGAFFYLPERILSGPANLLIPVAATLSSLSLIDAGAGADVGSRIAIFVPLLWSALYLKLWKSLVTLVTMGLSIYLTSDLRTSLDTLGRFRLVATSTVVGALLVYAIHALRYGAHFATLDRDHMNADLRAAIQEVEQRDELITNISQGVMITNNLVADNPISYVSPSVEKLTGYTRTEMMGRNCRMLQGPDSNPDSITALRDAVREGRSCVVELLNYCKDGSTFWNSVSVTPVRDSSGRVTNFVGVLTDVSERHELEERLGQSQKMEVVGTLAAGMAHDFNNSLLVIRGYNSLLNKKLDDPQLLALTQHVDDAVHQASEVTHRLLTYSRRIEAHPSSTDVNQLLTHIIAMWGRLLGDKVRCELELDQSLPDAFVDRAHLEQVIVNLITNANDAMPQGGVMTLRTSEVIVEDDDSPEVTLPRGSYVSIAIEDSGIGMDEATRLRIFEPFFTTKTHGTGLGLATVANIIREGGGHIDATSTLGRGTTVRCFLPKSDVARSEVSSDTYTRRALIGNENVLVVEDLNPARELLADALGSHGYNVLSASNGREAFELVSHFKDPIDLLVTDVDMPEMGGPELARAMLERYHGLRVIFVSGYPAGELIYNDDFKDCSIFIAKPYDVRHLMAEMRKILV